jgi:hypothetical protein
MILNSSPQCHKLSLKLLYYIYRALKKLLNLLRPVSTAVRIISVLRRPSSAAACAGTQ